MKSIIIGVTLALLVGSATAKLPNIVVILADDQAWNGTSVAMIQGNDSSKNPIFQTPNLARLATQGVVFSQAYASHCKCECSRASIQMGRSTSSLNCPDKMARDWSAPLSDSLVNLLKQAEPTYRAAHFGKWQWFHSPAAMGYDFSDGITHNQEGNSSDPQDPKLSFSITRRAQQFIETQVKEDHPFYLQLSYYAVHPQAQALAATQAKYSSARAEGARGDRAVMAAMTEDLDTCVGEVLKKLADLKIADQTLVIYTSDNGGRTGYLKGGKGDLGEGGLRVPLIVCGPGIKGGIVSNEPVISYDLTPTVLDFAAPDFAGGNVHERLEGDFEFLVANRRAKLTFNQLSLPDEIVVFPREKIVGSLAASLRVVKRRVGLFQQPIDGHAIQRRERDTYADADINLLPIHREGRRE